MDVATVLTACGIETTSLDTAGATSSMPAVATVLTACGIETVYLFRIGGLLLQSVATVLTACGIETEVPQFFILLYMDGCNSTYRLRY